MNALVNREEVFKAMHVVFTGKPHGVSMTIAPYEDLTPDEGIEKAEKYLAWAKKGQDNCMSDSAYWGFEGDITLATVLTAVFRALKRGVTDFPPMPDLSPFLMDKTSQMQEWAEKL